MLGFVLYTPELVPKYMPPGFHTCFSRTHNGARCDVWTPMLTSNHSLRNKSLRPRNKVAQVELLRELVRPVPRCAMTVTDKNKKTKIFGPPKQKKRAKLKT